MGGTRDDAGYSLGRKRSAAMARAVRNLLQEKGHTQTDLSRATGIPTSHLSNLLTLSETRHRNFQGWHVEKIAEFLGVDEMGLLQRAESVETFGPWGVDGADDLGPRDYFAARALVGLMQIHPSHADSDSADQRGWLAKRAYAMADAMLAERNRKV